MPTLMPMLLMLLCGFCNGRSFEQSKSSRSLSICVHTLADSLARTACLACSALSISFSASLARSLVDSQKEMLQHHRCVTKKLSAYTCAERVWIGSHVHCTCIRAIRVNQYYDMCLCACLCVYICSMFAGSKAFMVTQST